MTKTNRPQTRRLHRRLVSEQLENRRALSVTLSDTGYRLDLSDLHSIGVDVELGDLDADGDLDAFVGIDRLAVVDGKIVGPVEHPDVVLLNDGKGRFSVAQFLSDSQTKVVALGDVDGDGDIDAVTNDGFWTNDGEGRFTDGGDVVPMSLGGLSVGDVDQDGDLDVVSFFPRDVWLNDGIGGFHESGQELTFCTKGFVFLCGIQLADFDGDDDLDLFAARFTSPGNFVWRNDGSGKFFPKTQEPLGSLNQNSTSFTVKAADLDGDSDRDVVVANVVAVGGGRPPIDGILWNDGEGGFIDSGQKLWDSMDASDGIALGDLNGDGHIDVAVSDLASTRFWLNDGFGNFTEDNTAAPRNVVTLDVEIGDLDGDNDLDVFVVEEDGHIGVWLNQQTFAPLAGDANRDRRFDQHDIVAVLRSAKYLESSPATFAEGDWNGDGAFDQLDIVAALQTGTYLQGPYAVRAVDSALTDE